MSLMSVGTASDVPARATDQSGLTVVKASNNRKTLSRISIATDLVLRSDGSTMRILQARRRVESAGVRMTRFCVRVTTAIGVAAMQASQIRRQVSRESRLIDPSLGRRSCTD